MTSQSTIHRAVFLAAIFMPTVSMTPAAARPPTVEISPGYDARLAEQRAANRRAEQYRVDPGPRYRVYKKRRYYR